MKTYFDSLSEREKGLLLAAVCAILFYIYYFLIYTPLQQSISQQTAQLAEKHATYQWINHAQQQDLDQKSVDNHELLSILATSLKASALQEYRYQLEQTGINEIQLHFQAVPFNLFLQWLIPFSKEYRFLIREWQTTHTKTPGVTQLTIRIQS